MDEKLIKVLEIMCEMVWSINHLSERIRELEEYPNGNWSECEELWKKIEDVKKQLTTE